MGAEERESLASLRAQSCVCPVLALEAPCFSSLGCKVLGKFSSMGGAVEVGHRPLRGRPQLRPHANEKRNDLPSMKHQFRLKTGQRFENVLKHINWH